VNFARTAPSDSVVLDAAANWASELGVTSAAVTSDGSAFADLAAAEFRAAAANHGIQVSAGEAPKRVAVAPEGGTRAVYQPETGRLTVYGPATQSLEVSAQLDPERLPGRDFATRFERRFQREPGPAAAYGYEAMGLVLQGIREAGTDASSFRDDMRNAVIGAHRDGTVLGSYSITDQGDTTECMIQRYRIRNGRAGQALTPLGAPCPPD
jgi:ABC-type branched-subunit amino acid transport system substrate-binding protein